MKLLKDCMDKTCVMDDLQSLNLPPGYPNPPHDPVDIVQGFRLAISTASSRYTHPHRIRHDTTLQSISDSQRLQSQSSHNRAFHKSAMT